MRLEWCGVLELFFCCLFTHSIFFCHARWLVSIWVVNYPLYIAFTNGNSYFFWKKMYMLFNFEIYGFHFYKDFDKESKTLLSDFVFHCHFAMHENLFACKPQCLYMYQLFCFKVVSLRGRLLCLRCLVQNVIRKLINLVLLYVFVCWIFKKKNAITTSFMCTYMDNIKSAKECAIHCLIWMCFHRSRR